MTIEYKLSNGDTPVLEPLKAQVQDSLPEPWREAVDIESIQVSFVSLNLWQQPLTV